MDLLPFSAVIWRSAKHYIRFQFLYQRKHTVSRLQIYIYILCVCEIYIYIVLTLMHLPFYCVNSFFSLSCDGFIATEFNVPTYMCVYLNVSVTRRSLLINIMCYIYVKNIKKVKVKHPRNRPCRPRGVLGSYGSQTSRQRHSMVVGCQPLPPGIFLVLIFTRG